MSEKQERKVITIVVTDFARVVQIQPVGSVRKMVEHVKKLPLKLTWQQMEDYKKDLREDRFVRVKMDSGNWLTMKLSRI